VRWRRRGFGDPVDFAFPGLREREGDWLRRFVWPLGVSLEGCDWEVLRCLRAGEWSLVGFLNNVDDGRGGEDEEG